MKHTQLNFDFEQFKKQAHSRLKNGAALLGSDGVLTPLIKQFLDESLEAELDLHLEEEGTHNRRNGKRTKALSTSLGPLQITTPRDRNSSFQPQIVPKRKRTLGHDLERQIIALYARGSSYAQIRDYLSEMYDLEVSSATLSRVTDKILPLLQQWRSRALERVYPFLWLDALHYKVRHEGRVVNRCIYCVIGLNQEGYKDLLGLYIGEEEGARFWLSVLTDLRNRGVEDVFIASIDNLNGFAEAIESIFPQTEVQLCVIHQIRNSLKYIAWRDKKAFMRDLRSVYRAASKDLAASNLDKLALRWGDKYPMVIQSWRRHWDRLSHYFAYTAEIRRVIYTTNMIESFHRQLRSITKTKGCFSSDDALLKLLYLVQEDITSRWKRPIHNWNMTLSQLSIIFGDRLRLDL